MTKIERFIKGLFVFLNECKMTTSIVLNELNCREERAEQAFIKVMDTLSSYIAVKGFPLPKNKLTIVDLGSGSMPYGNALERWALTKAEHAKVVAVDTSYLDDSYIFISENRGNKRIEKLSSIEEALKKFEKPDLITMFHPDESLIKASVGCLEKLYNTPILGAIFMSDSWVQLKNGLESNGYNLKTFPNPHSKEISERFALLYSPLFAALPANRSELRGAVKI